MSNPDPLDQARFSVGIDLGTTNSVLACTDLTTADGEKVVLETVPIPQLTGPGSLETHTQLPSFLYQPHEAELASGDRSLPWDPAPAVLVGEIARMLGSKTPMRLVASAKSWLCHPGVNRRTALLPIDAPPEVPRVSPLEASMRYLQHLASAWNHAYPDTPLQQQRVILTVPASFDPAARDLTLEAAHAAGLSHAVLLEEPQAALYSWIQQSAGQWRKDVEIGDIILVVDVGGGTTDLSLIAVTAQDGNLELTRLAIGEHILLGGDNMDLALAYRVKATVEGEGKKLEPWQIQALTHLCRDGKEALLSNPELAEFPLVVPSRGSSLIGGSLRTCLTRSDLEQTLVHGFFPQLSVEEPLHTQRRTGLTTIALPYAQDARITAHLAAFLRRQRDALREVAESHHQADAQFLHPTAVLLNGGAFKSTVLTQQLLTVLNHWLEHDGAPPARLLSGADYDLAVARGAAYYGYVRQARGGVRIRGGTAAAYYVGIESAMPAVPGVAPPIEALCVAPFGMEEGTGATLPPFEFGLVVGEPVRFRFLSSTTRRQDGAGVLLETWDDQELEELPEIEITLPADQRQQGEVVPVRLEAQVTEVGTLKLEAVALDGDQRWQVEFQVRES